MMQKSLVVDLGKEAALPALSLITNLQVDIFNMYGYINHRNKENIY